MELQRERSIETRDQNDSQMRGRWDGGYDDMGEDEIEKVRESSKHRSHDRSKSSRSEEKDHQSKDHERPKTRNVSEGRERESKDLEKDRVSIKDRRNKDKDKDADRDKYRDKERERDQDRKDRGKDKLHEEDRLTEKDSERGRDRERVKEKSRDRDKEREKEIDRAKDRKREREREKHKDREKETDRDKERQVFEREKGKEKIREKHGLNQDKEKSRERERERSSRRHWDENYDRSKDIKKDEKSFTEDDDEREITKQVVSHYNEDDKRYQHEQKVVDDHGELLSSVSELEDRVVKMREERLKKKSESTSEVLSWVNRIRRLEEKKNAEKEKALQLSKIFEEQDNVNEGESDGEGAVRDNAQLSGVKVLHGLDRVIEGGAVVLTLKDQSILADGDINQESDMLENVEIGEQRQRDEAYRAAKKKSGIYDDKFNNDPGSEKKILPQYDDPVTDEGITLDASGRFTGEAEKKIEELRRRIHGDSTKKYFEDLNSSGKILSDYYTQEELPQFKKTKKKKSLRRREKLDINALEAEAVAAGLGAGDLGSRKDGKTKALKEEQEKFEAEMRSKAYQSAYAKADEASKALRLEQTAFVHAAEDDETPAFNDDDDDLQQSLERARKLALRKQNEEASGPQAIARLATSANDSNEDDRKPTSGESQENKVVLTEMEGFVWGLQLDEEVHRREDEDVFMEEDVAPKSLDQDGNEDGGWTEVEDTSKDENPTCDDKEEIIPDETIREVAVGKGLSGALKLLKDRGTLQDTVELGGRNMDKKKSKLVGIYDEGGAKEIHLERTDEYGRILAPKEAFRLLSHKFHGKGPGKTKLEKRMRQYQEELKIKQMKNADTPSSSVEKMREVQAKYKTPYIVLSGHVQPGQTSDPRSGFATVEKEVPGSLTPMLGDRKVEHFLGIKRKPGPSDPELSKKSKS